MISGILHPKCVIYFNPVTGWTYFSFDFVELHVFQLMRLTLTQKPLYRRENILELLATLFLIKHE